MGIFDIFKGKHKDDVYHSGSREAQRHWAQYQKFQDAQNRVLGEPAGMMPHAQNINADAGLKYTQKNIKDPETGDRDPNGTYKTRGFNQLANSIRAGEAASLAQENPKAADNLIDNLADMRRRLTNDFTRENYMARSHAIRAEFEARLPKAQAATAFDKYIEIMQDPEASKRLTSSEAVRKGSEAYQYGLRTIAAAKKLEDSTARHKEASNQLLEEELGTSIANAGVASESTAAVMARCFIKVSSLRCDVRYLAALSRCGCGIENCRRARGQCATQWARPPR